MIQAGIILIAVAAGTAIRASGGVPDDASRWTREHHQAAREFAKVTLAIATVPSAAPVQRPLAVNR